MKPWQQLTDRGKLVRLRRVALDALRHYPIRPTGVRLIGGFVNALFRVDADEGVFALRVDLHQEHTDADTDIELAWLADLADAGLPVAEWLPATDGRSYVHGAAPGVPDARRCTLFRWIGGRPLQDTVSPERYAALGRLSAALHLHGAGYRPPHLPMAWDRIFYFTGEEVVLFEPRWSHLLSGDRRQVLERAMAHIEDALGSVRDRQIVHGDLHPWNVHVRYGTLTAFDFEDVMWASPAQDIAITLYYNRNRSDYTELAEAFEGGYRTIGPWPASDGHEIESFIAARSVMFLNFVLGLPDDPRPFFDRTFADLERYLAE